MEAALNSSLGRTSLGPAPLRIGRAPDNTLVISDPQASGHHVEVTSGFGGNGYQVTDLGSTNGTFVNEQRLAPQTLRTLYPGDVIRIGALTFTYEVSGAGYAPTVVGAPPDFAAAPPQPAYQQPPAAYGNANMPIQQPAYTPPPAPGYPQPGYPQAPAGYPQQAPGYPQPGGFGLPNYQSGPPPRKKSSTGLVIAIVVILLLLIGGGAIAYFQLRSTPQKTLAAYCDGLKTNNAQELYNTLSSADQAKTSVSKLQQGLGFLALVGGVKDCTVNSVTENGSTAIGSVTLTSGQGKTGNGTVHLIDENGTWKIQNDNSNLPTR